MNRVFSLIFCLVLTACKPVEVEVEKTKESPFPYFTTSQLLDLSKNERNELERLCLSNAQKPVCIDLKSDGFKNLEKFRKGMCETENDINKYHGSSSNNSNCDAFK